jgi:protein SCO1/2
MRRWLLALLMACALAGCRERTTPGTAASSVPPPSAAPQANASASPRSDRSIYALPMTLTDQDGQKVGLDVFRGRPTFIGMFYSTCPSACPLLVSAIKRVMSGLGLDAGTDAEVRVLLVSFDPETDTPDVLRAVVAHRELDARWKLASAPPDQVRELAALLGIQYRRLPDGKGFSHTSTIVLLDREGAIDTRLDDTAQPVEPLVARAKALASLRAR